MIRVLLLVIGYIFGLFQTGYFYGKIKKVDLKKEGSGNTGATNALRVMGVKSALIIFLFDALKAFIPCLAVRLIFKDQGALAYTYLAWMAAGVILGNDFPFFLKWQGGKGVAATSGWCLAWSPVSWIIGMSFFFIMAFATRLVSLASILAMFVIIGLAAGWSILNFGTLLDPPVMEFFLIVVALCLLLIARHGSNIKRLLNGTENRFGSKKKDK